MVVPIAIIFALFANLPLIATLGKSVLFLPLPVALLLSVFRTSSKRFRWWVFQYLGVSTLALTASVLGLLSSLFISANLAGYLSLLLLLIFTVWSIRAANKIHTKPIRINSSKIKTSLRAVHISDIHVGSRSAAFLKKVVEQLNTLNPDVVLITGDLLDENVSLADLQALKTLTVPVFYCSGNHERYVDYERMLDRITQSGVIVLNDTRAHYQRDEAAKHLIDRHGISIIGVQDRESVEESAEKLELGMSIGCADGADPFNILLYHQPNLWNHARQFGIDLMLSGHTHNGQIWPFGLLVRFRYPQIAGHYKTDKQHLYVSPGTGTWGPVMRFCTRCEMTLLELEPN